MLQKVRLSIFLLASWLCVALACAPGARSQQTLGGITGTVTDTSGGVLPDTMVTLVGDQTDTHAHAENQFQRLLRICELADRHLHPDVHSRRFRNAENSLDHRAGRPHGEP